MTNSPPPPPTDLELNLRPAPPSAPVAPTPPAPSTTTTAAAKSVRSGGEDVVVHVISIVHIVGSAGVLVEGGTEEPGADVVDGGGCLRCVRGFDRSN